MKKISVDEKYFTLVDDEDYDWLVQWRWHLSVHGYVYRIEKRKYVFMHREIMHTPDDKGTDHIDGLGRNNQRKNLRSCTPQQNQRNAKLRKDNKSGYKGVCFAKNLKKWRAYIRINKKLTYLGYYDSPVSAALTYDSAAQKYFGEFAHLNFPVEFPR
jgi:hypothetical protein